MKKKSFKISLAWQILIALILGITLGAILHNVPSLQVINIFGFEKTIVNPNVTWTINTILQPAGDLFIRLIKMIVVPIVLSSIVVGVAGIGDSKKLGRIGVKTIVYFEVITTIAIVVGITFANVFHPGTGIDISTLTQTDISQYASATAQVSHENHFVQTLMSLVPTNIFAALMRGDMLAIIFFAVLFGVALSSIPAAKRDPLLNIFSGVSETMFKVTNIIMHYAPVGVFALIAVTVSQFGFSSLLPLLKLVSLVYAAILFFAIVIFGIVAKICGLNIFKLILILKDELILAYSTSSSETVLPRIMEKMEHYGAPRSITSFVIPTGYSFNLDGSTLYQSIAAIFIAQLFGYNLTIWHEITLVLTLMITSKGIAGVPGVSFVVLLATLGSVIDMKDATLGLAFIAGVDRIMDMARTALNVVGNSLAALVIAKWEGQFDVEKSLAYEKQMLHHNR
ncbi:glutamate/aspartate:proton symporter GltP [Entomomonas asaccharolytica]|uniref:Glutamate/aspartate:proton symporter GltP n=1 Tax=Entomomonas asaccharolytica TaxID=2785331 RepID=A0A974ND82_9GAMM|nr:glutamate/aspartate:proton symporter GltP [Entomomonas asaccharolytica]QQP84460.1 glutamate/aspartate:proton symporter GltP [Entomomonas asaccharolytica]